MNRSRRGLLTVVLAAWIGSALPAVPAAGLSCAYLTPRDVAREADVIYVGLIGEELSRGKENSYLFVDYRVDVRRTLLGAQRDERRLRSLTMEGWGEPREFPEGKRILVVDNLYGDCYQSTTHEALAMADRLYRVLARAGRIAAPHTVERGEYLWSMARDRLTFDDGDPTRREIRLAADKIYDRNRDVIGSDPDRVRAGMRLLIPRLR